MNNTNQAKTLRSLIVKIVSFVLMAIILGALVFGNVEAYVWADFITEYFYGLGNDSAFDSEEMQQTLAANDELVQEMEEEGIILLRNETDDKGNKALPLTEQEMEKINLFGWGASDAGWINGSDGSVNASSGQNKTRSQKLTKAFTDAGIEYNTELINMYTSFRNKRSDARGLSLQDSPQTFFMLIEPGESYYRQVGANGRTILENADAFSDVAIVVFSRLGGEGCDCPHFQSKTLDGKAEDRVGPFDITYDRTYLDITTEEEKVLELASQVCEKVIVILNTCNNMNLEFLDRFDVDACLSVGTTGQSGVQAIPRVLSGEVNPSGKTTATQPYDLKYDPTYWNSGRMGGVSGYQVYQEGIYVGYKWYETADAEGYWDEETRSFPGKTLTGYDAVVQYPFGFGLSYTEFEWEIVETSLEPDSYITAETGDITVKVRVTNVGDVPGKDVVQLYYTPPYKSGGIEKAHKNLVAFAKTVELKPANMTGSGIAESQVVELTFNPYDMASYDCYDKNYNRNVGYELDSGEYIMSLSNTAHDLDDCAGAQWSYNINGTIKFRSDPVTGNRVTNRFTNYDTVKKVDGNFITTNNKAYANYAIDGSDCDGEPIVYLTRQDFASTFPTKTATKRVAPTDVQKYVPTIETVETAPTQGENNGLYLVTDNNGNKLSQSQLEEGDYVVNKKLVCDLGLDYESETWEKLLNQMSKDDIYKLVTKGSYSNAAIESIGKPKSLDSDGPAGLNRHLTLGGNVDRTNWTMYVMPNVMAQSWNSYISYSFGLSIAKEAKLTGNSGWYAPGANMQRSFFCGRNSEYYSEDSFLSGVMASESCRGSINNGMYVYLKHFALNETETNRIGLYTWCTEQTLREIYLRPYEIAVKEGGCNGIMASLNRVGGVWTGGCRALTHEILRDEWGFRGSVVTDSYCGTGYNPLTQAVVGGVDLMLGNCTESIDMNNPTLHAEMRESAKNILYAWCNAYATAANHKASDDRFTVNVDYVVAIEKPFPWWMLGVVAIDVAFVAGIAVWTFFVLKPKKVKVEDLSEQPESEE